MESLTADDLTIEVEQTEDAFRCTWLGKSNARQPRVVLAPFFEELLTAAAAESLAVEMSFAKLDHFNSSTITALIRLIQSSRKSGVKLALIYDHELKWQRLSFEALHVFDKNDELFELRNGAQ